MKSSGERKFYKFNAKFKPAFCQYNVARSTFSLFLFKFQQFFQINSIFKPQILKFSIKFIFQLFSTKFLSIFFRFFRRILNTKLFSINAKLSNIQSNLLSRFFQFFFSQEMNSDQFFSQFLVWIQFLQDSKIKI